MFNMASIVFLHCCYHFLDKRVTMKYVCPYLFCSFSSSFKSIYLVHIKATHAERGKKKFLLLKCPRCNEKFTSVSSFGRHSQCRKLNDVELQLPIRDDTEVSIRDEGLSPVSPSSVSSDAHHILANWVAQTEQHVMSAVAVDQSINMAYKLLSRHANVASPSILLDLSVVRRFRSEQRRSTIFEHVLPRQGIFDDTKRKINIFLLLFVKLLSYL